jgi:hypothetical protein
MRSYAHALASLEPHQRLELQLSPREDNRRIMQGAMSPRCTARSTTARPPRLTARPHSQLPRARGSFHAPHAFPTPVVRCPRRVDNANNPLLTVENCQSMPVWRFPRLAARARALPCAPWPWPRVLPEVHGRVAHRCAAFGSVLSAVAVHNAAKSHGPSSRKGCLRALPLPCVLLRLQSRRVHSLLFAPALLAVLLWLHAANNECA